MAADFTWESVIVGSSLSAVAAAEEANCPILFNKSPAFFKFSKLSCGAFAHEKWQSAASDIAIKGLNPFGDKITLLRVNEGEIEVVCHNKKYTISCENIKFFDDEAIENFPFDKLNIEKYHVCDWFRVTSGAKHDFWFLDDEEDFVKKIYFLPKITLPKYKDCVSESYITENNLNHVDYTSTMARHKTAEMMKRAGILGTKHTKTYRYPIKLDFIERQVFEIKEEILLKKDNYILDSRELK